ncbi:MAG: FG-GAP repeat domain-containing protein, partial [Bdellovibrionota bacterium]
RTYLFGLGFNVNLDSSNLEDLILYSQSANQFQILTNTGSGSFISSGTQAYSSNISWMSAAAYKERSSVNNKWHLLAVSDSTKPVLFQMTGSAFSAVALDTTLTAAIRSLTADFNSDGFQDFLIIPKFSGVAPLILKNDSDVSFQQVEMARTGSATISEAATGDFNADGKIDIVLATSEGFEIHINASPDSNTIVFQEVISQFDPNSTNVIWMAVGEVTGDGVLDVMVARNNAAPIILAGLGNYQFGDFTNLAFGSQLNQCFTGSSASSIKQVYFSSIRKNGKNDVIVANEVGDLCVLFNQGS